MNVFARVFLVLSMLTSVAGAEPKEELQSKLAPYYQPPAEFADDFGDYRSPLKFADGSLAGGRNACRQPPVLAGLMTDVQQLEFTMPTVPLSGSVGQGGVNNTADVTAVQQRLKDFGFHFVVVDGLIGPNTIRAIKLFQSIKNGRQVLESPGSDGRVDVGGDTHKWLEADNAPRWQKLPLPVARSSSRSASPKMR